MGINTNAYLPGTADLSDIVIAIQRLTDADKVELTPLLGGSVWTIERGQDYFFGPDSLSLTIHRKDGFGDFVEGERQVWHQGSISFNAQHEYLAEKPMIEGAINVHGGNASAFWAALCDALVDFFGGVVDYNDCDSEYADTRKRRTYHSHYPHDGEPYYRHRKALEGLTTVTDDAGLAKYDEVGGIYNRFGDYVRSEAEMRAHEEWRKKREVRDRSFQDEFAKLDT